MRRLSSTGPAGDRRCHPGTPETRAASTAPCGAITCWVRTAYAAEASPVLATPRAAPAGDDPAKRRAGGVVTHLPARQGVDLGGEDEVVLVKTLDLVRPGLDHHLAPREMDVGMMSLPLGQLAHLDRERHGGPEVREDE